MPAPGRHCSPRGSKECALRGLATRRPFSHLLTGGQIISKRCSDRDSTARGGPPWARPRVQSKMDFLNATLRVAGPRRGRRRQRGGSLVCLSECGPKTPAVLPWLDAAMEGFQASGYWHAVSKETSGSMGTAEESECAVCDEGSSFYNMFDQEVGVVNLLLLHLHIIHHRLAWSPGFGAIPYARQHARFTPYRWVGNGRSARQLLSSSGAPKGTHVLA